LRQAVNEDVADAVHDPDHPKISRALEKDGEQQTDAKRSILYLKGETALPRRPAGT